MEERRSDTEETYGDQGAPQDVSNQNNEEPSAPVQGSESSGPDEPASGGDEDAAGAGGEEGQATGHPQNAG